jgi:protein tyrosine phosphatase type 4A
MAATVDPPQRRVTSAGMTNASSATSGGAKSSPTYYKPAPAEITFGPMRFLITERPSDLTMPQFIEECQKHNVKFVVRVCEPSYETRALNEQGIQVLDWEFSDGSPPPNEIRDKWLSLMKEGFKDNPGTCIAVHCVAGLGRAPVMVAIALMEAGVKYEDTVEMIRKERRGALNTKQLQFLEKYKPTGDLKKALAGKQNGKDCSIM